MKVLGKNAELNARNSYHWRQGHVLRDTSVDPKTRQENALGLGYSSVPFSDVLVASMTDINKHVAWRFPRT